MHGIIERKINMLLIIYLPELFSVKKTASVSRESGCVIWHIVLASMKQLWIGWTNLLSL